MTATQQNVFSLLHSRLVDSCIVADLALCGIANSLFGLLGRHLPLMPPNQS